MKDKTKDTITGVVVNCIAIALLAPSVAICLTIRYTLPFFIGVGIYRLIF